MSASQAEHAGPIPVTCSKVKVLEMVVITTVSRIFYLLCALQFSGIFMSFYDYWWWERWWKGIFTLHSKADRINIHKQAKTSPLMTLPSGSYIFIIGPSFAPEPPQQDGGHTPGQLVYNTDPPLFRQAPTLLFYPAAVPASFIL